MIKCICFNEKDVPLPPEGPLHPTDVTKSSCVLRWNPPKDDGGSEVTHYIVEKMDADTLRWVPVGDAAGTTMRYSIIDNIQYCIINTFLS